MKTFFLAVISVLVVLPKSVQTNILPVKEWNSSLQIPFVLYITGDGGFNNFSTSLCTAINKKGYSITALNAKSYFWETKSPEDAAKDVSGLITEYLSLWKRNEVILVGYSFGADVMPFIQTRLSPGVINKIRHTVLFSPSKNTDFTIHLFYGDDGSSVISEINKLNRPVLIVFGDEEKDLPDKQISNKNVLVMKVAGDHHYDDKISEIINDIAKRL